MTLLFRSSILAMALSLGLFRVPVAAGSSEEQIEAAVVSIEVTSQRGDWAYPWQQGGILHLTGSGFIIEKGVVMTNAHVVSDAKQIIVRRNGVTTPYFATVEFIAHDSDLVLLRVEDPAFDDGVKPLVISELPSLRTRVRTYGFPAGGEKISRTEGIVSRIEFITYIHTGADGHLAIQTDSAINPGNSGGPVMQDGRVIGVAFQANTSLNDVGFFIPTTVIRRFLVDIEDGRYDGYPELGIRTSNLINGAYRRYLRLPEDTTGIVVDSIIPTSSADGLVFPDDVIVAIGDYDIGNEGNIKYYGHSLGFEQIAEEKQVGGKVVLTLWRDGRTIKQEITLTRLKDADRVRSSFDVMPRYFVYAGMVFMELDREYLNIFGNYWDNADENLLYDHFFSRMEKPRKANSRTVILSRILPHEINRTYRRYSNSIVTAINGRTIDRLETISEALEAPKHGFHIIELGKYGKKVVVNKDLADAAHAPILRRYGVRNDRRFN